MATYQGNHVGAEVVVSLTGDLEIAAIIAEEAGDLVLSYFRSDRLDTRAKGDRDLVTRADMESERLIRDRLGAAFPEDGLVGEEGTDRESASGRHWFVDPVDGTLNYAHGLPIWCVSLSLFEGGRPVLGVIRDPLRGETFTAARGHGVRCNEAVVETSGVTRLTDALVHLTIDFNEESLRAGLEDIQVLAPRVLRTRNIGSAALALAYVAAGRLDAMLHRYAHPWDYGAGVLMVEEAGGAVTDLDVRPYTSATEALVAGATPALRSALAALLLAGPGTHVE